MSRLGKILYLISGLSLIGFLATRFILGGFVPQLWIPLGLFLACIMGSLWVDRRLYLDFLMMKTTKHGMNMGGMILAVILMLSALNFVSIRHYKTFDFSLSHQNSLSDQSVKLLQGLESELKITFFYKEGGEDAQQNRKAFQNLVKRYQDVTSKVSLDFVEVNKRPDLAEQYGVTKGSGVIFVEYKGRRNRIDKIEEQEITSAIVKATREKEKNVYLITGHGEGDLENVRDPNGLSQLKSLLEGNRYQVKTLPLATKPEVPKDADVVLIVGPKQSFLDVELTALENYLKQGGNLFVAVDPGVDHGLSPLLAKAGVKLGNNYVITVMQTAFGRVADPSSTPGTDFSATHAVTKVFGKNEMVVFRMPQSIEAMAGSSGITLEEIVKAGENSIAYTDNKFQGEGLPGTYNLVGAVKGKLGDGSSEFQMVIAGDSDFANNQLLFRNLNRDLVLNSVLTLAKEENMVSITPKEIAATQMTLTENNLYLFLFAFVIPLPLLMMGMSGYLWYRRRNA